MLIFGYPRSGRWRWRARGSCHLHRQPQGTIILSVNHSCAAGSGSGWELGLYHWIRQLAIWIRILCRVKTFWHVFICTKMSRPIRLDGIVAYVNFLILVKNWIRWVFSHNGESKRWIRSVSEWCERTAIAMGILQNSFPKFASPSVRIC